MTDPRSLALVRGRILISGFARSPLTLAVYDVVHSLPIGGVGRGFPFAEDEIRRHFSYVSCTIRERDLYRKCKLCRHGNLSLTYLFPSYENAWLFSLVIRQTNVHIGWFTLNADLYLLVAICKEIVALPPNMLISVAVKVLECVRHDGLHLSDTISTIKQ